MKCQKCAKPATYQITDLDSDKPGVYHEFHFCDEHARDHLELTKEPTEPASMGKLAEGLMKGGVGRESSAADKQSCPLCRITFLDFRNTGRLGCPHDYEVFRDELMPLLENIHEETRHAGKVPKRAPRGSRRQTTLIQLRNDLKRAIAAEDYETAARVRDEIKNLEQE